MKKILILCACLLVFSSSPVTAQTGGPSVAVVFITSTPISHKAVITREDGKSEVLEIPSGKSEKNLTITSQTYQKLIAKLYQEGYTIKSTFGGELGTTLIFVKGQ